MTLANHMLVGTLIAVTVKQPTLVLPLAFASHFVLDALPHYGLDGDGLGEAFKHKLTFVMEAIGIIGVVLLINLGIYGFNLPTLAAFLAVSPDFEWIYRYYFFERKNLKPPTTFLTHFHQRIQKYERKWGIVPEILFFVIGYSLLLRIL